MGNLETQLQAIGRADILKNFKHLAYSSYSTRDRLLVTEIRRSSDGEHTNGFVNGTDHIFVDPSSELTVQVQFYSSLSVSELFVYTGTITVLVPKIQDGEN